jgi:hypothetical protein
MGRKKEQKNDLQGWSDIIMNSGRFEMGKIANRLNHPLPPEKIAAQKEREAKEQLRLAYRILRPLVENDTLSIENTIGELLTFLAEKGA